MRITPRSIPATLVSGLFLLGLTACPGEEAPPPPEEERPAEEAPPPATDFTQVDLPENVTLTMVADGEQLYRGSVCVACHGAAGEGTALGPSLDDTDWINISHDFDQIMTVIREGVDPPQEYPAPMPPMGGANFTDDQIRALAAYVYALAETGS